MAEIKTPKGSPSIDMTPMVDLAFLLVTFFMLAATFRTDEPVEVSIPSSIGEQEIPEKTLVLVTVDKGGRIFFSCTGEEVRKKVLAQMAAKYKVPLSEDNVKEFARITSIGCSMNQLPQYLSLDGEGRKNFPTEVGIPSDSLHNELKDWINFANREMLDYGKKTFEEESSKLGKKSEPLKPEDYKPKFVLKAAMDAEYVRVKSAIETFRDLKLNNLNFVTSQEAAPLRH
ncbi:Biopolymer transport protein ExbD/TolR [compost metagenome]